MQQPTRRKGPKPQPVQERFWPKVNKSGPGGCWLWVGYLNDQGYGTFYVSVDRKRAYTHRLAYEWQVGPIPAGMELDHLCRVRHCLNPLHLEPVAPIVNLMRSDSPCAENKRKTHCIRGHEFTSANTYTRPDNGNRQCRVCNTDRVRASTARRRAAKAGHK